MSENELKHYGVKGMKWGVRRSIGARARTAALYKKTIDSEDKTIRKLEGIKSKKGLTDRQAKTLKQTKKLRADNVEYRNKLVKDISKKDIARGERALRMIGLLGASSAIPMAIDHIRADKALQREHNR